MSKYSSRSILPLTAIATLALAGCLGPGKDTLVKESFSSDNTFSRSYPQSSAQACEAARRALLSQGYTVAKATADTVQGTKNFQPQDEVHEQLDLRVSCVAQETGGSLVFVSAVQDRYALKKSPTSASVGVGMIGSVSLPIGASDDSLVRVASITVQDDAFYQAFFDRVGRYLPPTLARSAAADTAHREQTPPPPPAPSGSSDPPTAPATPDTHPNGGP